MKTIASAALLLGLASAAHAEFTLYGLIDASYGKSVADDATGLKADFHSGGDNTNSEGNSTTRFGLKGSTDVGSGVKANFNLQSNGITSDGEVNSPFFGRQAWVGLSGDFGEVRLGRQDSVTFQTMIGYDFNGASNGIAALGYANVGPWGRGRVSRSLQYISPSLYGVKAQFGFQPKGNVVGAKSNLQVGVTFASGPVSVSGAYETRPTETGDKYASIAGSYDFSVVKVMAAYAKSGTLIKGYSLGLVAPVLGGNVGVMAGRNSESKGKAYEIFANKEVFKNVTAYVEYGHADAKAIAGLTAAGALPVLPADTTGSGYAVGLIYAF